MCPNHVDSELQNLEASGKVGPHKSKAIDPISSRRKLRIRRPKEAKIIDIGLRRGFKNNGLIEIENETSEEEDEKEQEMSGGIYRVPERGIKLDFIDRVKRYSPLLTRLHLQLMLRIARIWKQVSPSGRNFLVLEAPAVRNRSPQTHHTANSTSSPSRSAKPP